jgi:class 3 adenylate cyclase
MLRFGEAQPHRTPPPHRRCGSARRVASSSPTGQDGGLSIGGAGGSGDCLLTTLLSCDMVGASARIVALGDRRWLDLQRECIALVRDKLARHGGEAINIVGDEILAKFDGAGAAIRCGLAIRDAVLALKVAVKIGIHAGEVEATDVSGITVVTCVRIRAIAQPGEVLVSSTVKELVTGSGITFTDRGTHAIKELPGGWRLFAPA